MKLDRMGFNWKSALAVFRLGTELVDKLPAQGDGWLAVLVKLLAMADSVDKVYGGKTAAYADLFAQYKLRERASEPFVRLFFGTDLSKGFKLRRHIISEHLELIEALAPDGGRLFFQEFRYGKPEISSEFFFSEGFDFAATMAALWSGYPHGLYLSVKPTKSGWGSDVTFSPMGAPRAELVSQRAAERIAAAAAAWRARGETPWCFLAYGPPGTGKTGHVEGLAAAVGGRLLKVDATSLPHLGVEEVAFLLEALAPRFLLIDDFEEAPDSEVRPRLRYLFEHLHRAHAGVTVAVTVNDPSKLDEALLRTERIDEVEEFALPKPAERADILARLVALHVPGKLDTAALIALVTATEGFNHADLAGLVVRFKTKVVAAAMADMKKIRDLAAACAKKDEPEAPEPTEKR